MRLGAYVGMGIAWGECECACGYL